jgi:hypothetical protein
MVPPSRARPDITALLSPRNITTFIIVFVNTSAAPPIIIDTRANSPPA